MGNVHPIKNKFFERGGNDWLRGCTGEMQGLRGEMEDEHSFIPNLTKHPNCSFFAIFDGHAGRKAALYCKENLYQEIDSLNNIHSDEELTKAVCKMDDCKLQSGTTCVFTIIEPNQETNKFRVTISNLGDSRALLIDSTGTLKFMTYDHHPSRDSEIERITKAGGRVINNRVNGQLAVSRAIGDFGYKGNPNLPFDEQFVIPVPEISHLEVSKGDILLLTCDGIFEASSPEKIINLIIEFRKNSPNGSLKSLVSRILEFAFLQGSSDNMSVIVVVFGEPATTDDISNKIEFSLAPFYPLCLKEIGWAERYVLNILMRIGDITKEVIDEIQIQSLLSLNEALQSIKQKISSETKHLIYEKSVLQQKLETMDISNEVNEILKYLHLKEIYKNCSRYPKNRNKLSLKYISPNFVCTTMFSPRFQEHFFHVSYESGKIYLILIEPTSYDTSIISYISENLPNKLKKLDKWDPQLITNVFVEINSEIQITQKENGIEIASAFVSFAMLQPCSETSFECIGGQVGLSRVGIGKKEGIFVELSDISKHEIMAYNSYNQEFKNSINGIGDKPSCEPHISKQIIDKGEFVLLCTSSFFSGNSEIPEQGIFNFIHRKLKETDDVETTLESLFFFYQDQNHLNDLNNIGAILLRLNPDSSNNNNSNSNSNSLSSQIETGEPLQKTFQLMPSSIELLSQVKNLEALFGEYFYLVESFNLPLEAELIKNIIQTRIRYLNYSISQIENQFSIQIQEKMDFMKDLNNLKHVGILFDLKERMLPKLERLSSSK